PGQKLPVVGEAGDALLLDVVQRVGQSHVGLAAVVAVGFAVGGDVDELGPGARVGKGRSQAIRQVLAAHQQVLERHGARDGAVVEEHGDVAAAAQVDTIGGGGVDAPAADVSP